MFQKVLKMCSAASLPLWLFFFQDFSVIGFLSVKKKKKKESFRPHFFEDGIIFLYS